MTDQAPEFLELPDILRLHRQSLEEFGGADGIREPGLLESALASARNEYYYGFGDLFAVAAAYGFHIAEAQAFIDGNKRTAIGSTLTFLHLNGVRQFPADSLLHDAMIAIANHKLDKHAFAEMLRIASGTPGIQEPTTAYSAAPRRVNTRLARGSEDVDFSGIPIEGNTPGVHLIRAMHSGVIGAEVALVWIVRNSDAPLVPSALDASLKVHLGVYSSGGATLGWLVFSLLAATSPRGQAIEYLVDGSNQAVMNALADLDRQSHWHIDARSVAGDRLSRFEFENVFEISRVLELLQSANPPADEAHFLRLRDEFQATYSTADLLAA